MSTHSDYYYLIKETIENHDKNVVIHSIAKVTHQESRAAANNALHAFIAHHYIEHDLSEDDAEELHALVDREVPYV